MPSDGVPSVLVPNFVCVRPSMAVSRTQAGMVVASQPFSLDCPCISLFGNIHIIARDAGLSEVVVNNTCPSTMKAAFSVQRIDSTPNSSTLPPIIVIAAVPHLQHNKGIVVRVMWKWSLFLFHMCVQLCCVFSVAIRLSQTHIHTLSHTHTHTQFFSCFCLIFLFF